MKHIFTILILLLLASAAHAQYHGGAGDGYASTEVKSVVLGIDMDNSQLETVNLYPNPAKAADQLMVISGKDAHGTINICNALGQTVITQKTESERTSVPLSALSPGTYLVYLRSGDKTAIHKLVILQP